jgi:hypothetical protein
MSAAPPADARSADLRRPLLVYLISRTVVLAITLGWFNGDTETYFQHGHRWLTGALPYRDYEVEYPPAATLLFAALATVGSHARFRLAFIAAALVVDALVFLALARRRVGVIYALASACLYPILFVRFDLFPAAAVLAGVLGLSRGVAVPGSDAPGPAPATAATAGAWLGTGIALKLYPLLFFPLLALGAFDPRRRRLSLAGFAILTATAAGVVAASFLPFLLAGTGPAVLGFLRYQGERGLQIESSYASVLLLLRSLFSLDLYHHFTHHAHDVAGPAAAAVVRVARVLHPAAVLAVTILVHRRRLPVATAFAAILAAALAASAVFSPQFLLWLLPLSLLAGADEAGARNTLMRLWLGLGLLTTLVFPILYNHLIALRPGPILLLFTRNAALVGLAVWLLRRPGQLFGTTGAAAPHSST